MGLTQEPPKNKFEEAAQKASKKAFKAATAPLAGSPKLAARLTDNHVCPLVNGIVPHVGGPITGPGVPTVLIGGQPAAVVQDVATCVGPPDKVVSGSQSVKIGGKSAVRILDPTDHGGIVVQGFPTVLIGD